MNKQAFEAHAVILAGGRGTRFWPRSRTRTPKQLLNITGNNTMLQQTVARILPLFPAPHIWTVTNREQAFPVKRQLSRAAGARVLIEPVGRNTAAAIGLAAVHILKRAKAGEDALMAVLPADHFVAEEKKFRQMVRTALEVARAPGRLVVLGIPPTRADTGFGYIEKKGAPKKTRGFPVYAVRQFTEKPKLAAAKHYVRSGKFQWNAGMFFFRVGTFLENLKRYLPDTYWSLRRVADYIGTPRYDAVLAREYRKLKSISIDYAMMEPATREKGASRVFVLPAEVGWNDIGSWASVYELLARKNGENVSAGPFTVIDAEGNLFWSPDKFVAAIGVKDLVVVETRDALLICRRERAQEVGKIVKWLDEHGEKTLV
jgi:mannose-1-phosphate guanylyltransferase